MRKRSGQVHSRESSATLQLTVSLLYLLRNNLLKCGKTYSMIKEKEGVVHDDTDEGTGS